jgi:uncharacterized protein YajQ (UPF0234 family)
MHQPCQNAADGASAQGCRTRSAPAIFASAPHAEARTTSAQLSWHCTNTRRVVAAPRFWKKVPMPSFDIVSEVNQVEVRNALDQANKEISTRFDFKGSDARVEQAEKSLTLYADDDFKLKQVTDVLIGKLTKRQVDIRALEYGAIEKISGNKVKQVVTVRAGVDQDRAKKIVRTLKDSKLKVQASIQGDAVRVSGAKKDELQNAIALVRKTVTDYPLQYRNFRD